MPDEKNLRVRPHAIGLPKSPRLFAYAPVYARANNGSCRSRVADAQNSPAARS